MSTTLHRYFYRAYAHELSKSIRRTGWGAYGEAVFKTWLILFFLLAGATGAVLLLLLMIANPLTQFLNDYRQIVIYVVALAPMGVSFLIVRKILPSEAESLKIAPDYASDKEQARGFLQFLCALLSLAGLPWIAYVFVRHVSL